MCRMISSDKRTLGFHFQDSPFVGTMGFEDTEGWEVLRKQQQKTFGAGTIRGNTRQTSWGQRADQSSHLADSYFEIGKNAVERKD